MTMREIRALTGLSQAAFSKYSGIPMRSIQNWEMTGKESRKAPEYVLKMLERIVREDFGVQEPLRATQSV